MPFPQSWINGPKKFDRALRIIRSHVRLKKLNKNAGRFNRRKDLVIPKGTKPKNNPKIWWNYVPLSKGKRYRGLCPFHTEKTASFFVYERKGNGYFKCFGCGRSGDIFKFILELNDFFEPQRQLELKNSNPMTYKPGDSFADAVIIIRDKYLGGKISPKHMRQIRELLKKKE